MSTNTSFTISKCPQIEEGGGKEEEEDDFLKSLQKGFRDINNMFKNNSNETVHFTMDPIVSSDVIGTSYGAVVDGLLTNVLDTSDGQLVKIVAWYDNEMGYCNQMLRTIKKLK